MIRDGELNYSVNYITIYNDVLRELNDIFTNCSDYNLTPDEVKIIVEDACDELRLRAIHKLRKDIIKKDRLYGLF